jgi:hypothetical protein
MNNTLCQRPYSIGNHHDFYINPWDCLLDRPCTGSQPYKQFSYGILLQRVELDIYLGPLRGVPPLIMHLDIAIVAIVGLPHLQLQLVIWIRSATVIAIALSL